MQVFAQSSKKALESRSVSGIVRNEKGVAITDANILLTSIVDSILVKTNKYGTYTFSDVKNAEFVLSVSHISYGRFTQKYLMNDLKAVLSLPPIVLKEEHVLKEVYISKEGPLFKKDTVEYWAKDYIVRDYARLQDLLKRMPGISIGTNGTVYFNGQEIKNAKFNGIRYFSGDVKAIIKELPADIVERIQIIDDYGDESRGEIKRDDPVKTLNVVTKEDKSAGTMYSLLSEYTSTERYKAEIGYKSIDFTDQKNFKIGASREPLGLAKFGATGSIAERQIQVPGVGTNGALFEKGRHDNYRGETSTNTAWGRLKGDHYYNGNFYNLSGVQRAFSESSLGEGILNENNQSAIKENGMKHSLRSILSYIGRRKDMLNLTLDINYEQFDQESSSDIVKEGIISQSENINKRLTTRKPSFFVNGSYAPHLFNAEGTDLLINYYFSSNPTKSTQALEQLITGHHSISWEEHQNTDNFNSTISATLRHQFAPKLKGKISVGGNLLTENNNRNVFDLLVQQTVDSISRQYGTHKQIYHTKGELQIEFIRNLSLELGLTFQRLGFEGKVHKANDLGYHNSDWYLLPSFKVNWQMASRGSLELSYQQYVNTPLFRQLYALPFMENQSMVSYGNPFLKNVKRHSFNFNLNRYFAHQKLSLGLLAFLNISENQIVTQQKLVTDPKYGFRINNYYLNASGDKQLMLVNTLSKSFGKWSLKLNGNSQWTQMPFFNYEIEDLSKSLSTSQVFSLSAMLNKWLDLDMGTRYEYSKRASKIIRHVNNSMWSFDLKSNIYLPKNFRFSFNVTQRLIDGFGSATSNNKPFVVNGNIEKRIFKRKNAILSLAIIDLLKQNIYPVRQYTTFGYQDRITNQNSRFFQLQFLWEPQNWKASKFRTDTRKGDGSFK